MSGESGAEGRAPHPPRQRRGAGPLRKLVSLLRFCIRWGQSSQPCSAFSVFRTRCGTVLGGGRAVTGGGEGRNEGSRSSLPEELEWNQSQRLPDPASHRRAPQDKSEEVWRDSDLAPWLVKPSCGCLAHVFKLNSSARPSRLFRTSPASTQCHLLLLLPTLPCSVILIPPAHVPSPPAQAFVRPVPAARLPCAPCTGTTAHP